MIIKDISSIEKGKYLVHFEEGQVLVLYKSDMRKWNMSEGSEVSEEAYQRVLKEVLLPRAKNHAGYYLSYRNRSIKEVITYLKGKHYDSIVIEDCLAFLHRYSYVDDYNFTRSFIKDKTNGKPYGARALHYLLRQKGIDSEMVSQVLEELGLNEVENCLILINKRLKGKIVDMKERQRIYGYLQRRGFNSGVIRQALQVYETERNEEF